METPAVPAKPTTAEEIYNQVIKPLPPSERFKLATIILNDISPRAVVDYNDDWSEIDVRDLTAHSMQYAAVSFAEMES
jgi:hypothetical protein